MLILRFKRDVARRCYSVTFLTWSPPWHILKLWFTDYPTFQCLVDEEIEKVHESGTNLDTNATNSVSYAAKCIECLSLGKPITSNWYLQRLIGVDASACKASCFEIGREDDFEFLPPYEPAELEA